MFCDPQAVAIIGASRTPGKLGYSVLQNVIQHGFKGAIYPVNPKAGKLLGHKCDSSVAAVPGPIDLAVILIPSQYVPRNLTGCGEKGIRGAIVLSAGFREAGQAGRKWERELVDIARRYGMRLSQLVTDFSEIVEFDLNPLVVSEEGQGAIGIDMRLVLE
jgi:acyl-CoA synthetase (NDP forming)